MLGVGLTLLGETKDLNSTGRPITILLLLNQTAKFRYLVQTTALFRLVGLSDDIGDSFVKRLTKLDTTVCRRYRKD